MGRLVTGPACSFSNHLGSPGTIQLDCHFSAQKLTQTWSKPVLYYQMPIIILIIFMVFNDEHSCIILRHSWVLELVEDAEGALYLSSSRMQPMDRCFSTLGSWPVSAASRLVECALVALLFQSVPPYHEYYEYCARYQAEECVPTQSSSPCPCSILVGLERELL